jgi:5'-nucleotidase
MKTLLLTNDDGVLSPGLRHLGDFLSGRYDVYVVAPDRERSGISMCLTINQPLRLTQLGKNRYAVDGTPGDCVNIALQSIMPKWPDFIISGMNDGENLCEDVFFSGTVAGAFIGHIYGIPSLAVSLVEPKPDNHDSDSNRKRQTPDFETGARITEQVLEKLLPFNNTNVVYNLNIPPNAGCNSKIVVTSLGLKRYKPTIVERVDPRGRKYYWIGTGTPVNTGDNGTDLHAVVNGDIALSILKYDLNNAEEMNKLVEAFNET